MKGFIEVTNVNSGFKCLVNINSIEGVAKSTICFIVNTREGDIDYINCNESYEEIKLKIIEAQKE